MLNPFQKSNLKIATPQRFDASGKKDPSQKPNIVRCFESVVGEAKIHRSGRATMALCPFHGENNASFAMYEDNNSYYCFTCGEKGDSYSFLMNLLNCDFLAAKEYAQENGLFENI